MYDRKKIKDECLDLLNKKINILKTSIQEAQNSSNNETKSTAGDKHETSRAMAQLEVERLSQQLLQQEKLRTLLNSISPSSSKKIQAGSVVRTNKGIFYLSVAIGVVEINNVSLMTMGMGSPLSQLMLDKTKGDEFSFNGNKYYIEEIF